MCCNVTQRNTKMSRKNKRKEQVMDAELRVRLPGGLKSELERMAEERWLKSADLVREALVQYVRTHEKEAA